MEYQLAICFIVYRPQKDFIFKDNFKNYCHKFGVEMSYEMLYTACVILHGNDFEFQNGRFYVGLCVEIP